VKRSEQKNKKLIIAWILQVSQTGHQKNVLPIKLGRHSLPHPKRRRKLFKASSKVHGQESGLLKTPEEEKETKTLRALASDISEGLNQVKRSGSNEKRAVFKAFKSLAFGEKIKKAKAKKSVGKLVNPGEKSISRTIQHRDKNFERGSGKLAVHKTKS